MTIFKGFANFGLGGVLSPPPLAPVVIPNQGLAMPTPVNRGALSTDTDGRKVALPPYGGEYLLLPNFMFIAGLASTPADLHLLRYTAAGALSWDFDKTDLTTEGLSVADGAGFEGIYLDTTDAAIYVLVADGPYSGIGSPLDVVLAKILYDASGTISQSNGSVSARASGANSLFYNTRVGRYFTRNGDGTGNFSLRAHGYLTSGTINEGTVSGQSYPITSAIATAGGLANYQTEDGTTFLESWNNTHICLRRGGVSRSIATGLLPNAVPTFSGGSVPSSGTAQTSTAYALPSNATLGPGICVMPWGVNEVVLVGLSTESIFGQRYYARDAFDTWLKNLCTFIGI